MPCKVESHRLSGKHEKQSRLDRWSDRDSDAKAEKNGRASFCAHT